MNLWEQVTKNPEFQKYLKKLPEDEQKQIQESLRQLVAQWETYLLNPLQKLK